MNMEIISLIITVIAAHFLALLSPGPDFILVVKSGIRNKKNTAVGIAVGIAFANGVYITLCMIGVGEILARSLVLMKILKILGGLFLTYIAYSAIQAKKADYQNLLITEDLSGISRASFAKEFITGFLSGISNPKNLIFYLSLFSLVLTQEIGVMIKIGLGIWMTGLVFTWDAFIIFVLSQNKVQKVFSRLAYYIDKAAGIILGVVGIKLIESAIIDESI